MVQSKHHGGQGEIGSTSADLWRSINSWCDALEILEDAPLPLLSPLGFTTQRFLPEPSGEVARDPQTRDVAAALAALRRARW
ncbi:hypothetical protein ACQ88U_37845 [Streptomyces lividans]